MWPSEKEWNRTYRDIAIFLLVVGVLLGVGVSWVWRHVNVSTSIQVKP